MGIRANVRAGIGGSLADPLMYRLNFLVYETHLSEDICEVRIEPTSYQGTPPRHILGYGSIPGRRRRVRIPGGRYGRDDREARLVERARFKCIICTGA